MLWLHFHAIFIYHLQPRYFSFSCPADRCCLYSSLPVFGCPLASAYIKFNVVYLCFNQTVTCFDWFYVCFELMEPCFPFCGCVSSDPQSSRARKLCVTMEPALLLKGDILVGNFPYTLHHSNMSIIFTSYFHTNLATKCKYNQSRLLDPVSLSLCLHFKKTDLERHLGT